MKTTVYVLAIAVLVMSTACTTIDMSTYEDSYVYAELETNDPKRVTLTVDNRSGTIFTLEETGALYRYEGRESHLVLLNEAEGSRLSLAPNDRHSWNFVARQALTLSNGTQSVTDWVPANSSTGEFHFAYRLGEEERSLTFPDPGERSLVGRVTISVDIALPFLKPVAERRAQAYEAARVQARDNFGSGGKELRLVNLRYDSSSNGLVEKVTLRADVVAVE
ncbi:MAG: hypothetical protein LBU00_08050 [Treponema sp.]|jgi:hypothetical protein|nr:hypothetical protein [Treponema sp.]